LSLSITSLIHATCLVYPFSLTWSPKQCLVRCTDHKPPRFVVFTTPLLGPKTALNLCSSLNVRPSYDYGTRLPNMYFCFPLIPVQGTLLDMLFWLLLLLLPSVLLFLTQMTFVSLLGSYLLQVFRFRRFLWQTSLCWCTSAANAVCNC
jgi:hypothetical protein